MTNVRFIDPIHTPEEADYPGFEPRTEVVDGLCTDRDVTVLMRDGAPIYVDIYRPEQTDEKLPVLVAWGPYGKHGGHALQVTSNPLAEIDPSWKVSKYAIAEAPDPVFFCPKGYAVIFPDPRGTWETPGEFTMSTRQEAEDYHDLIEWAGTQSWSNGKVATTGVSYLGFSQWCVAATRPPHLAAINPWEGLSDLYREIFFHGGIPETRFIDFWLEQLSYGRKGKARHEDIRSLLKDRPLMDEYWEEKQANLAGLDIPAYVVAGWSSLQIHLRGTLEAYKQIAGENTWLEVHGQKIWKYYYQPASVERQLKFFDWALKGKENGWRERARVEIEVREAGNVGKVRSEREWPLARTAFKALHLDGASAAIRKEPMRDEASVAYAATLPLSGQAPGRAVFDYKFDSDTELTGHMKLRVWIEIDEGKEADVFAAVQKVDKDGQVVGFPFQAFRSDGPVTLGWLRASHRALDPRSTPEQPWHSHRVVEPLTPGVPVPLEIELWPSSTRFAAGETLRVVIQGSDVYPTKAAPFGHDHPNNIGRHIIHTGGQYDSHLLIPVVR